MGKSLKLLMILAALIGERPMFAGVLPFRMIYIQGFTSCNGKFDDPVEKFKQMAKTHPDAKLFWGCYDSGILKHPLDNKEHFFLRVLSKNGWSALREIDVQQAPMEIKRMLEVEVKSRNPQAFDPKSTSSSESQMNLMVAGHSHGGWMAMRFVASLQNSPQFDVHYLLTIDPISYTLCDTKNLPTKLLETSLSRLTNSNHDCHRAPRDLEPITPIIAQVTQHRWTNFYQSIMTYIASGPIQAATNNMMPDDTKSNDWYNGHSSVLRDPKGWRYFYSRLDDFAKQ